MQFQIEAIENDRQQSRRMAHDVSLVFVLPG